MHPLPLAQRLSGPVNELLHLLLELPQLSQVDTVAVQRSLKKAIAPTFEIVFAGAFSAGKSMLINALLGRELLYSAEGHATGTECQIAYAAPDAERVVLTFLSEQEIWEQIEAICERLGMREPLTTRHPEVMRLLLTKATTIVQQEGGESKSERAKQATAMQYLIQGYQSNQSHIDRQSNQVLSMEQLNFSSLPEAASYARRGTNSAVLKRIEYYCHHPLLQDGNVLVDTPGIDAPVKKDADLAYAKIQDPDASAVVCVLKAAASGEMTSEETTLLETTRRNAGIRDRVFYAFNRVDEAWYNTQLRQRLDQLLRSQFAHVPRVYQTSALLGFWGGQLRQVGPDDRFGLDSIFSAGQTADGQEETPQFVSEFNRYCGVSGRLPIAQFKIDVRSYETPNQNYVRILREQGQPLIEQLVQDSGIEQFRAAITNYLAQEKLPSLLANLVDDLRPVGNQLRRTLLEEHDRLRSQPTDITALKEQELRHLSLDLQQAAIGFRQHLETGVNQVVASGADAKFEEAFAQLQRSMVQQLDGLLAGFSVGAVHQRAQASHRRNSVVPLLGILAEAFYYLANGLEETLAAAAEDLVVAFFQRLRDAIPAQPYYQQLLRMLGDDGGIEPLLDLVEQQMRRAIVSAAQNECDRYVRESPEFFAEDTASIFQLRQTLQQACNGYDYNNMVQAEPAIRQLLKLDFEQKVTKTVMREFRQTMNQTLNTHLLPAIAAQVTVIQEQYDRARLYLSEILEQEAIEKQRRNQQQLTKVQAQIQQFNQAITAVNNCIDESQSDLAKLGTIVLE